MCLLVDRPPPPGRGASGEHYVQGMLNLPDQPFAFVITNLTCWGIMNVAIRHHRSSSWRWLVGRRGGLVNYASLWEPNRSHVVEADYANGNRKMVLGTDEVLVDNENANGIDWNRKPFTVREAEEARGRRKKGLYFDIQVSPDQTCRELVALFAEGPAVWEVTSEFARQVPCQNVWQNRPKPLEVKLPNFLLGNTKRNQRKGSLSKKGSSKQRKPGVYSPSKPNTTDKKCSHKTSAEEKSCDVGSTLTATLRHKEHIENAATWIPKFLFQFKRFQAEPTVLGLSVWPGMESPPAKARLVDKEVRHLPTITDFYIIQEDEEE